MGQPDREINGTIRACVWRGDTPEHYGPEGMREGVVMTIAARMAVADPSVTSWGYTKAFNTEMGVQRKEVKRWDVDVGMMRASHFAPRMWPELANANGLSNMTPPGPFAPEA
jgi:hypothetical protein